MGIVFLLIAYALPAGVVGLCDNVTRRLHEQRAARGAKA